MADKEPSKVVPLPLTRERATDIVREIATDSRRWSVLVAYTEKQDWRQLVNRRQIDRCLRAGYVLTERAELDDKGHWRFQIGLVSAGQHIVIDVALESSGSLPNLYVLNVDGNQI